MNQIKAKLLHSSLFSKDNFAYKIMRGWAYFLFGTRKKKHGKNNIISAHGILQRCRIEIIGNDNYVEIGNYGVARGLNISIYGNNNRVTIGSDTNFTGTNLSCWDDNNKIVIGNGGNLGKSNISAMEGKKIVIGDGFLLSFDVEIRTSDSHSIFDENNQRINNAKDIYIANNVWIAQKCLIFKGAGIPTGSVIGANSFVNKQLSHERSVYVGSPVRELRTNITWNEKRE